MKKPTTLLSIPFSKHITTKGGAEFGEDNNKQTDRHMYISQNTQTHTKSTQIKWGKSKVLGVYVLNLKIMSIGEDDNRQTNRQPYSSQKAKSHIKSA